MNLRLKPEYLYYPAVPQFGHSPEEKEDAEITGISLVDDDNPAIEIILSGKVYIDVYNRYESELKDMAIKDAREWRSDEA